MRHTLLYLFLSCSVAWASEIRVIKPAHILVPGKTLALEIHQVQRKPPTLFINKEMIPFQKNKRHYWRVLTRVPLDQSAGPYSVEVKSYLGQSSKKVKIPIELELAPASSEIETIQFNEEKSKLLNDPSEDAESKLIRKFLKKAEDHEDQLWEGAFDRPIPGGILSVYGISRNKIGQKELDFHRGVDLKGTRGQLIKAPNHGQVLMVRDFKFHGRTVLLSHGQGIGSIYIHMESIKVKEGMEVKKGDVLGTIGSSGLATGPHLHWGIYVHGKAVDPLEWCEVEF